MYGAYHTLIKYVNSHSDIYRQNLEQVLIEPRNKAWSVFAEAYDADARDYGVTTPHYSLAAWIHWNINFDDPMRETASLFPEPVCNANQEFVPAIELLEYGFPVSSPSGDEPSGACASGAASSIWFQNDADLVQNGATLGFVSFPGVGTTVSPGGRLPGDTVRCLFGPPN